MTKETIVEMFTVAHALGWFIIMISLLLLFKYEHIRTVMQDVIIHPGLFFVFALFTVVIGLLMVTTHNIWLMNWQVLVTIFSWIILFSGLIRLACPNTAMRIAQTFFNHPVRMQITGSILLIIGVFLLWHVYTY